MIVLDLSKCQEEVVFKVRLLVYFRFFLGIGRWRWVMFLHGGSPRGDSIPWVVESHGTV